MVECLLRMQKILGSNPSSSSFFLFNFQNSYVVVIVIISQWADTTFLQLVVSPLANSVSGISYLKLSGNYVSACCDIR